MFRKFVFVFAVSVVLYGVWDFHAGNTFFAGTYSIPMALFVFGSASLIVTLIGSVFSKKVRTFLKYLFVFCFGILLELVLVDRIAKYQAMQSIKIGNMIIEAIERSYADEGDYKNELKEYVPDYIVRPE